MFDRERLGRIYLVGFMGVGKTTVGECLAEELRFRFIDLDREIEKESGRTIPEIFSDGGETEFRRLEARALRIAATTRDAVIAAGGGTLTLSENRDLMRRTGVTVWLDAPLEVMLERCRGGEHRPLLADPQTMGALLAERLPAYRQADLRVDASGDPPGVLAFRIISMIAIVR